MHQTALQSSTAPRYRPWTGDESFFFQKLPGVLGGCVQVEVTRLSEKCVFVIKAGLCV